MSGYKGKWPYTDLKSGDWVCCGGGGFFSAITRMVTGGGMEALRNHNISTHTGILISIGGQLLVAEMGPRGIELNSLEVKYRRRTERVMCFRRPIAKDDFAYRDAIQSGVGELFRRGMEYDYKGLLEFINKRIRDSKAREYCSEMVYLLSEPHVRDAFPTSYGVTVSPEQLHTCPQAETIWTEPAK